MSLELKNIATITQVSEILGCHPQTVRGAILQGSVNKVYPFPNKPGKKGNTGPLFIKCDDKLRRYLMATTIKAKARLDRKNYDPVIEAEKHFEFIG